MKLQSIMNRSAAKEGTDLLDIIRLTLDSTAGPVARAQLAGANPQLQQDAARHTELWFADHLDRSLRRIHAIPEGRDLGPDEIDLVGDLLLSALTVPNQSS
jgi:hypothetical protein